MFITELSIKRPAVSWVMSLILIVFGLFVFWKLPVRELPSGIQPPVVQVQINYKSASASIVDQEVTQVVEDVIGGAEGIKNIDSKSENGRSTINVEFDTSIDLDDAAASSRSMLVSNSTFIVLLPFSDLESIFFIPSAPPITSSTTWVTSWSTIEADADL